MPGIGRLGHEPHDRRQGRLIDHLARAAAVAASQASDSGSGTAATLPRPAAVGVAGK